MGGNTTGGGTWGTPMATSTQMGGGYSGAHADNGLNPLQQNVLNVISSCMDEQGINIKNVVDTMKQQGFGEPNVRWVWPGGII